MIQQRVLNILKELGEYPTPQLPRDVYYPKEIKFGMEDSLPLSSPDVAYLLSKFPPCKTYKHFDSCTAYYPTNVPENPKKKETIVEVNPVLLVCEGLDRYTYVLEWFTCINNCFFKIRVRIDYGYKFVTIAYKYNDSRSLPKYSGFNASTFPGLIAYKYYGDSGEYMVTFKCEVENVSDINYFIL